MTLEEMENKIPILEAHDLNLYIRIFEIRKQIETLRAQVEALEARHPCNCICWDCERGRLDEIKKRWGARLDLNKPVEA